MPRELVAQLAGPVRALRLLVRHDPRVLRSGFTPRAEITHRMNVRRFARQKQAALAAHRSQVHGNVRSALLMRFLVAMPPRIFGLVLGCEWFAEPGAAAPGRRLGDILLSRAAAPGDR